MNDKQLAKEMQDALTRLARNPDFVEWLKVWREMRDSALRGMEGGSTEKLHQIAGAVTVYQAVLDNAAAYAALQKHDNPE